MIIEMLVSLILMAWLPCFALDVMNAREVDRMRVVLWSVINIAINLVFIHVLDVLQWGREHLYLFVGCFAWGQIMIALQNRFGCLPERHLSSVLTGLLVSIVGIGVFWFINRMFWL